MKRLVFLIITLTVATAAFAADKPDTAPRRRILMDAGWRFHLSDTGMLTNRVVITDWRCKRDGLSGQISNADWRWKVDEPEYQSHAATMASPGLDVSGDDWHKAKSGDDTFPNQRPSTGFARPYRTFRG